MCGTPHRSRRTSTTLSRPGTVMVPSSCARRPRAESSSSAREGSWADSSAGNTKLQSAGLIMERERLREVSQPAPTPGTPARSRGSPLGHFAPRGTAPRSPLPAPVRPTSSPLRRFHTARCGPTSPPRDVRAGAARRSPDGPRCGPGRGRAATRAPRRTGPRRPPRLREPGRSRCRTPSYRPAASRDAQREAAGGQQDHAPKLQEVPHRRRENTQEEGSKHGQGADDAALPHILETLTAPPAEDHGDEYTAAHAVGAGAELAELELAAIEPVRHAGVDIAG